MKRAVAVLSMLGLALVLPLSQASAAPAPAWDVVAVPFPTNFEAGSTYGQGGPAYLVTATNVGGAPTSGTFTITDTLPAPLDPSGSKLPFGQYGHAIKEDSPQLSCSVAGHKVTCTGGGSDVVGPGELVNMIVPVDVDPGAPPLVLNKATIEGGGAGPAQTSIVTKVSAEPAPFEQLAGRAGLYGSTTASDGSTPTQAGSHPYQQTVAGMSFSLVEPDGGAGTLPPAGGGVRDINVDLPPGTVVDPQATPVRCTEAQLETPASLGIGCPIASAVGLVKLSLSITGVSAATIPLYNMVPPPGYPAALGFEVLEGTYAHVLGSVSSDGRFQLSASSNDLVAKVAVAGVAVSIWGDPADPSHDKVRGACANGSPPAGGCAIESSDHRAFLTLPSSCGGPLTTMSHVDSWTEPDNVLTRSYESTDLEGNPVGIQGCNALEFEPEISSRPTTNQGDSPSGLDFQLHQPQHLGFGELATANLKNTTVKLPEGMVLNPSAAGGREACSSAQIGLTTPVGASPIRYREEPQQCPDASKLGTVDVTTPLLDHELPGNVYLAKPFDNPFGSLLAIYLAIEDEESGIIAKLAGKVEADPVTGQLTTSFEESPQLPLEDVDLHLFGGARGALTTPLACGTHTTTSALTPWSTPEGADAHPSDAFAIASCSDSEAVAPKDFSFTAGTVNPFAGAFSPFVLKLSRADGTQRLKSLDLTLPQGLTGKLAGIPYCSEAVIAQAQARNKPEEGKAELQAPSCPQASEVGTVTVGAGSGPNPFFATGHAYLAGPYKGAPLSMAIVTPAVAGPFDLGVVVVRVALQINLETAQIHAVSDPLPTILQGIPLDIRSVAVALGRPGFTINPTDCEPSSVGAQVGTAADQSTTLSSRFQVGGCDTLSFKPKLKVTLKGPTKRSGHPALRAEVKLPAGGANLASVQVALPPTELLDQGTLNKVCVQADLKAATCPPSSVYGKAKAWSPLLDKPLEGPVYLGVGYGHQLPDLVTDLNGQIRILAHGRVDTTKQHGLRNTFEVIPDAPVSRIVLELKGGKRYGLLENTEGVCAKPQRVTARFVAQNGKVAQLQPKIVNGCKRKKKAR